MAIKYSTKINLRDRKSTLKSESRFAKRNNRKYMSNSSRFRNPLFKMSKAKREKIQKIIAISLGVVFIIGLAGFLKGMSYLQALTAELPSPDAPFGKKDEASIIYAANILPDSEENEQLYRVFGQENREIMSINDVPEHVKWAFLAAEDVDFYEHPGFDLGGLVKAGLYEVFKIGTPRGGSTITQQLIKTVVGSDRSYERKIKEIIMALQVERMYTKDQILEMYLNTIPFGSNIYGLKTASKFYFGKEVSELTISEAAILARIPQDPVYNSPTLAPDPEEGKALALQGREYVIGQMKKNLQKINDHIESDDYIILEEELDAALTEEPVYQKPKIDIKAPHFVFYIEKLLTTEPYNNGVPFELSDIQTGGYKIYTTLDMNVQKIAEEEVLNGVNTIASSWNGHNGAAIVTKPSTGDIVAMVGSKSYDAESEGTLFDGNVNVTDTLQSMGSSMKPFGYYKAFEMGVSSPGSYLPDVYIEIGNYKPKNWNNAFKGPDTGATARAQLVESRNIPALIIEEAIGLDKYIDTLISFGYKTIEENRNDYGPALILGGGDVTMVEHAQAYGVFANGGDLVRLNPITKITKFNPETGEDEVVYERETKREHVADARAVYMINHVLNYKNGGPPREGIDGRDYAGKTGTTDNVMDTIFAGYSPDLVVIGWNGNNDNTSMTPGAWGENVTRPWVISLTKRIAPYFPEKTPFSRPGGLVSGNSCSDSTSTDSEVSCAESGGDLLIEGRTPPAYKFKKTFRVCSDQTDHLAREIDEIVGKAVDVEVNIYKMPASSLQKWLDEATKSTIPTEYCTIERSPNEGNPWAVFTSPTSGENVSGTINFNVNAYSSKGYPTKIELYFGNATVYSGSNIPYTGTFDISAYEAGTYPILAKVYDNTGSIGETRISVKIGGNNPNFNISTSPASPTKGSPATVNVKYEGSNTPISSMTVYILNSSSEVETSGSISGYIGSISWTPSSIGLYSIYIEAVGTNGVVMRSENKTVTVN